MEAQTRQSRIPKFGFGFKKLLNGDKSKDPPSSGSTLSSPSVTRSKSMRVPRTQVPAIVKKEHSNSIDNGDESAPLLTSTKEQVPPPPPSLLRPRSKTLSSRSHPNSRSNSPHNDSAPPSGGAGVTSSTGSVNETPLIASVGEAGPLYYKGRHTRSHSFGSKEKQLINNRPPSASSMNRRTINKGPSASVPTSTVQGKGRVVPSHSRLVSDNGRMKVNRTNSNSDQSDGTMASGGSRGTMAPGNMDKNTLTTGSGGRGKRPFSFHEGSPDLNQLASEMSLEDETTAAAASRTHREPVKRHTGGQGTRMSSSKLRPPTVKRNSTDDINRPSSAASNYMISESRSMSRPRSAADVHKVHIGPGPPQRQSSSQGSRSSTPSSGRSTPLFKKTEAGIAEEDEYINNDNTRPHPSYPSTPNRPPQYRTPSSVRLGRTPVIRSGRKSDSSECSGVLSVVESGVGLNELEGAVLIDAEDYRRMVQEVKTLKTMLLRLKRELAADGVASPPSTPPTSMKSSMVRLKQGGGANNAELLNKIQKLTSERDKALSDIEVSKKEQKLQQVQLETLKSSLETQQKDNTKLNNKLTELETHREYLLDRLERLHADKHKVEDRLNTLEKSAYYETTVLEGQSPAGQEDTVDGLMIDDDIENGLFYDDEDATY